MRYNSINRFLRQRFGAKVFKVSLDAKLPCPNWDKGGCIFCNPESFLPVEELRAGAIKEQLAKGIEYIRKRHRADKFIAYFQNSSNTNAPVGKLEELYREGLGHPDVVGIAIATRPDLVGPDVIKLLSRFGQEVFLWVELGLQSAKDATLHAINRGHSADDFVKAVQLLKGAGIDVCAHVILGLPGESATDIINTARFLSGVIAGWGNYNGVKIHNLHVLKDTPLEKMYHRGEVKNLSLESYASLAVDFLEWLDPNILIHRFNSHAPRELTIAPMWSVNKMAIINAVHAELERRNSYQGKYIRGTSKNLTDVIPAKLAPAGSKQGAGIQ